MGAIDQELLFLSSEVENNSVIFELIKCVQSEYSGGEWEVIEIFDKLVDLVHGIDETHILEASGHVLQHLLELLVSLLFTLNSESQLLRVPHA